MSGAERPGVGWRGLRGHVVVLTERVESLEDEHSDTPDPWVELRIHGVSGTPPEDLLSVPHVVQVAGDYGRRVYQAADCHNQADGFDRRSGRLLEGYHWGNLTSGSWKQAFWMLLAPFGLINAAQFMLPQPPEDESASPPEDDAPARRLGDPLPAADLARVGRLPILVLHVICGAMLRMVGLGMTLVFALTLSFIGVDLVGIRGAGQTSLADALKDGPALAAGLFVASLGLGFLSWVGRRAGAFKETRAVEPGMDGRVGLARWGFFEGDPSAPALRSLHLSAGLVVATLPVSRLFHDQGATWWGIDPYPWDAWLVGLITVVVLLAGDPSDSASLQFTGPANWFKTAVIRPALGPLHRACFVLALALGAFQGVHLAFGDDHVDEAALVSRIDDVAFVLVFTMVFCMLALALANVLLALATKSVSPSGARRYFGRYAGGLAASFVSTVGVFIGLGFAGAFSFAAAKGLSVGTNGFPEILQRIAYAWGLTAGILVALALIGAVRWFWGAGRRGARLRRRAAIDLQAGVAGSQRLQDAWVPKVATAMWMARLKRSLTPIVVVFALSGIAMSAASGLEWAAPADGRGDCRGLPLIPDAVQPGGDWCDLPGALDGVSQREGEDAGKPVMWVGTWTLLLLALGLVSVGRGAIRQQSKRRGANVLWDVISFWPHATHPFAPPAYSQLAVLHFRDTIRWHLYDGRPPDVERGESRRPDKTVVVSAHSQGSLLTLAALMWLNEDELAHVGLLTFGSQLQVAFPRAFPRYVNVTVLHDLRAALGHGWINLYRETDPIAGPVQSWGHWTETGLPATHHYRSTSLTSVSRTPPVFGAEDYQCAGGMRVCGDDWRLIDPIPHDLDTVTGPVVRIRGHSDYFADPHYAMAIDLLRSGNTLTLDDQTHTVDCRLHGVDEAVARRLGAS